MSKTPGPGKVVASIPKVRSPSEPAHFRLVSLTSCVGKLMEAMVNYLDQFQLVVFGKQFYRRKFFLVLICLVKSIEKKHRSFLAKTAPFSAFIFIFLHEFFFSKLDL